MTETAQVLKRAQVDIPFVAKRTKGSIQQGREYRVTSFTLFDSRTACDLCERPHQAERQAMVTTGSESVPTGLTCLHQVSGIKAKRIEKEVDGQLGLAVRVRHILNRDLGIPMTLIFEDTKDALQQLQKAGILTDTRHGASVLAEINEIRQRLEVQAIQPRDLDRLQLFTDYLTYLLDARDKPEF